MAEHYSDKLRDAVLEELSRTGKEIPDSQSAQGVLLAMRRRMPADEVAKLSRQVRRFRGAVVGLTPDMFLPEAADATAKNLGDLKRVITYAIKAAIRARQSGLPQYELPRGVAGYQRYMPRLVPMEEIREIGDPVIRAVFGEPYENLEAGEQSGQQLLQ